MNECSACKEMSGAKCANRKNGKALSLEYVSDEALVADLIRNHEPAWLYLLEACERHLAYHKKHLQDFGLTVEDLFNETYLYLVERDFTRLRAFRYEQSFLGGYLFNQIRAAKKRLLQKTTHAREKFLSDDDLDHAHIGHVDDGVAESYRRVDMRSALNQAFLRLWEQNTQRAYVYLLREKLEMPSKEVAGLLGLTVSNVDVVLKRAKKDLKALLGDMNVG